MLSHYLHKLAFPQGYVQENYERLMKEYEKQFQWAGVGGGRPGSGVNANSRVCRLCWIPKEDEFCEQMIKLIYFINSKKFGLKLFPFDKQPESVQLTVYSGKDGKAYGRTGEEEGGYYHKHMDSFLGDPMGGEMRKLSTTMALNKSKDYIGGEFAIAHSGFQTQKVEQGSMINFPSFMEHEVIPITKGVRASLVFWLHGPDFV